MLSWDDLFMNMVYLVAMRSKDINTHVGAIIVGKDHEVRSVGYNSFPRGINDNVSERQEGPEKYYWFAHAEANAIANAALAGISVKNCILYTNGTPCSSCAVSIINSGIRKIIIDSVWESTNKGLWAEEASRSLKMFLEAGVSVKYWSGQLVTIKRFRKSEFF